MAIRLVNWVAVRSVSVSETRWGGFARLNVDDLSQ
jgi:hypothetical protein